MAVKIGIGNENFTKILLLRGQVLKGGNWDLFGKRLLYSY